jgi:hypothetical protein
MKAVRLLEYGGQLVFGCTDAEDCTRRNSGEDSLRGSAVGSDLRPCATGLCWAIPIAVADAVLMEHPMLER